MTKLLTEQEPSRQTVPIKGHPEYTVDTRGKVFSLRKNKPVRYTTNHEGGKRLGHYYLVTLYPGRDGKKRSRFYVHRIVAEMFVPNPDNHPVVNHINGDKQDNRVENLEWVSHKQNHRHALVMGLIEDTPRGEANVNSKLTSTQVDDIRHKYAYEGWSQDRLARKYNTSQTNISHIITGKTWQHLVEPTMTYSEVVSVLEDIRKSTVMSETQEPSLQEFSQGWNAATKEIRTAINAAIAKYKEGGNHEVN